MQVETYSYHNAALLSQQNSDGGELLEKRFCAAGEQNEFICQCWEIPSVCSTPPSFFPHLTNLFSADRNSHLRRQEDSRLQRILRSLSLKQSGSSRVHRSLRSIKAWALNARRMSWALLL